SRTLFLQTEFVRKAGSGLPVLFSAVELSGDPAGVAKYLQHYSQTGLQDLGSALRSGKGGLKELLKRDQHFSASNLRAHVLAIAPLDQLTDLAWRAPQTALTLKWFL